MNPKPRPDCEGWWWVRWVEPWGAVRWKCVEVVSTPWETESLYIPDPVLQIKDACWILAAKVNDGIMDGSLWFPAARPQWPEGGAQ